MPTENDFLPFAVGGSANVTSQTAYVANTTLTQGGFQLGIANSADLNKVWRQSSIMSAVLAQFIVARTGSPAIDDGTTATLLANLELSSAVVNGDATKTFSVAPATAPQHAMQLQQATGRLLNVQVFASSGTYTPTAGTTSIIVEILGGGGGGGGASATTSGQVCLGGGGGGGVYMKCRFMSGFAGALVTIGAAGAAGGTGGNGGATSFGALCSAGGGFGGPVGVPFTPPGGQGRGLGGNAGTSPSGLVASGSGKAASVPIAFTTATILASDGGGSFFGNGGIGTFGAGSVGATIGSGGSGGVLGPSSAAVNGGAGAPGYCIVWEFA